MAYNISEVSGNFTGSGTAGVDNWETTADLSDPSVDIVTGDFDVVRIPGGNEGEATSGYTATVISGGAYGTLTFNTADGTFSFDIDRQAVIDSGSDQAFVFDVTGTSGAETDTDRVTINILICVEEGTEIATPQGPRRVETLMRGEAVTVLDGAGAVPLRWRGARQVTAEEIARAPELAPVRIEAGALGGGQPSRALVVSAQHRLMVSGAEVEALFGEREVLVPSAGLVGWPGITREAPRDVTFVHLLFDSHQVTLANGAPSESFHPGHWSLSAMGREARDEIVAAVPRAADPARYGPAARPAIRVREARALTPPGVPAG